MGMSPMHFYGDLADVLNCPGHWDISDLDPRRRGDSAMQHEVS